MKKYKKYLVLFTALAIFLSWSSQALHVSAAVKVTKIVQSYIEDSENSRQRSVLKGYTKAGKLVWTYKTGWAVQTELETISPYFKKNNIIYVVVEGKVIALSNNTGKVLWKTKSVAGASVHYAIDKKGVLYIGGYYGPDVVAINKKGKVLWQVADASSGKAYWPVKINLLSDKIEIVYDSDSEYEGRAYVDYKGKILEYKEVIRKN